MLLDNEEFVFPTKIIFQYVIDMVDVVHSSFEFVQEWLGMDVSSSLDIGLNQNDNFFQNIRKEEVMSGLLSIIEECRSRKAVHLGPELNHLLMNNMTRMVMNKTFFGPKSTADSSESALVVENIAELLALTAEFVIGDYIPLLRPFDIHGLKKRMRAVAHKNDTFFQSMLDDRRQSLLSSKQDVQKEVDFIDVLLQHSTANGDRPLTDTEIKASLQVKLVIAD